MGEWTLLPLCSWTHAVHCFVLKKLSAETQATDRHHATQREMQIDVKGRQPCLSLGAQTCGPYEETQNLFQRFFFFF